MSCWRRCQARGGCGGSTPPARRSTSLSAMRVRLPFTKLTLRCVGGLCRAQKVFGELGRERGFFTSVLTQAARTFTRTCIDFWWADLEEYIFADRVSILMAADHATDGGGGSLAPMDAHPTGSSGCGGGGGGVTDGEEEDGDGDGDGDGDDDRTVSGESSSS